MKLASPKHSLGHVHPRIWLFWEVSLTTPAGDRLAHWFSEGTLLLTVWDGLQPVISPESGHEFEHKFKSLLTSLGGNSTSRGLSESELVVHWEIRNLRLYKMRGNVWPLQDSFLSHSSGVLSLPGWGLMAEYHSPLWDVNGKSQGSPVHLGLWCLHLKENFPMLLLTSLCPFLLSPTVVSLLFSNPLRAVSHPCLSWAQGKKPTALLLILSSFDPTHICWGATMSHAQVSELRL